MEMFNWTEDDETNRRIFSVQLGTGNNYQFIYL